MLPLNCIIGQFTLISIGTNSTILKLVNENLPYVKKVFGQNTDLHTRLRLCRSLSINFDHFKSFELLKMYDKHLDLLNI